MLICIKTCVVHADRTVITSHHFAGAGLGSPGCNSAVSILHNALMPPAMAVKRQYSTCYPVRSIAVVVIVQANSHWQMLSMYMSSYPILYFRHMYVSPTFRCTYTSQTLLSWRRSRSSRYVSKCNDWVDNLRHRPIVYFTDTAVAVHSLLAAREETQTRAYTMNVYIN